MSQKKQTRLVSSINKLSKNMKERIPNDILSNQKNSETQKKENRKELNDYISFSQRDRKIIAPFQLTDVKGHFIDEQEIGFSIDEYCDFSVSNISFLRNNEYNEKTRNSMKNENQDRVYIGKKFSSRFETASIIIKHLNNKENHNKSLISNNDDDIIQVKNRRTDLSTSLNNNKNNIISNNKFYNMNNNMCEEKGLESEDDKNITNNKNSTCFLSNFASNKLISTNKNINSNVYNGSNKKYFNIKPTIINKNNIYIGNSNKTNNTCNSYSNYNNNSHNKSSSNDSKNNINRKANSKTKYENSQNIEGKNVNDKIENHSDKISIKTIPNSRSNPSCACVIF